jgi:hypothetical protein
MSTARGRALKAHQALLNGSGKLGYFEERGITREAVKRAGIGYEPEVRFRGRNGREYKGPAFTYPCITKDGNLLGIHNKSEARNRDGRRWQRWGGYADNLPSRGHGKRPDDPAKVIPFGLETLKDLPDGSLVVLCCGEEDALVLRQTGYTALSQPGAGLLEPVYARELAEFKVVVFYDAGEEPVACRDALKIQKAGAKRVRVVQWPPDSPNGADINARLIEDPKAIEDWVASMIEAASPVSANSGECTHRRGQPDRYGDGEEARSSKTRATVGRRLSEVVAQHVEWLWDKRIPLGKLTVMEGDPDNGKSALTTDFTARVSVGRPWPDGAPSEAGGVVLLNAEDGVADTIRPRVDAACGDADKVLDLATVPDGDSERLISIPEDLDLIQQGIERVGAKLVVVDPLMAFLSSDVNSHRDQDVRRALAPLAKLAEETGVAVVVVRHLNKASGGSPIYRGGGSIGIVGAARSALLVAKHPEDENLRVLARVKGNLAPPAASLAFKLIEATNGAVRVEWKGETSYSAAALLAAPADPEERSALDEAVQFLRETLRERPVWSVEVKKEARKAEISEATLRRAKTALGIRSNKEADGSWSWALPQQGVQGGQDIPKAPGNEHLEHLGHLPIDTPITQARDGQGVQGGQTPDGACIHGYLGGKGCYLCDPDHPFRRKEGAT